jgi:hypothetical protein
MKKLIPTFYGLLAGVLFGVYRSFLLLGVIFPFWIFCYAAIGALIGFGVGVLLPVITRVKINSPIWWFMGCTILVLLAFRDGSQSVSSYYLFPVGVMGMVISLILSFIPRMSAAGRSVSPASVRAEQRHPKLLAFLCIAHAAFLTAAMYYLFGSSNSILGIMWLVLLGVWPLWIVVFLMNGWKTNQIMVTMIIGLAILSPLFLLFLMMWSLG